MRARRRISSFCFALAGVGVGAVLLLLAGLPLFGGPGEVAAQSVIDYDIDNDNLIDIRTLAQLDAIRHDLDGDGAPVLGLPAVAYNAAFPNRDGIIPGLMGCPGTCSGYELLNDLDFDTNGDGSVTSADGHAYTNWEPIGGYNVTFDGKGHTISHLTINRPGNNDVALFANMGSSGSVTSLGLPDANVTDGARAAILIGNSAATVYASWSSGQVSGSSSAAGLVGGTTASIIASYIDGRGHDPRRLIRQQFSWRVRPGGGNQYQFYRRLQLRHRRDNRPATGRSGTRAMGFQQTHHQQLLEYRNLRYDV